MKVFFDIRVFMVVIAALVTNVTIASVAVKEPGQMLLDSSDVVVGNFVVGDKGDVFEFNVSETIKGTINPKTNIRVSVQKITMFFNVSDFVKKLGKEKVIILGQYDESSNQLNVNFAQYAIWPQGIARKLFDGQDISLYREFALNIHQYEENSIEQLIPSLLNQDNKDSLGLYAALDYSQNQLASRLSEMYPDSDIRNKMTNHVITILFLKSMLQGVDEQWIFDKLFSVSSNIPLSISIPWLMSIASNNSNNSGTALNLAKAHMKIRRLVFEEADFAMINKAYQENKIEIKQIDAKQALSMLDSSFESIRHSAGFVLSHIIGDDNTESRSVDERRTDKAYWVEMVELIGKAE